MEWHSGKSAVSFGKSFLWLFLVWALPRFCLVCCFLLTKRKSGWGICGSSWWLALCCLLIKFDLPAFMDQLCPCTNVFPTAYSHVRTEPQSDIGQTRGKKKNVQRKPYPEWTWRRNPFISPKMIITQSKRDQLMMPP